MPFTGNTLNTDPGLFFPEVMIGTRSYEAFPLYGEQKNVGAIDASLFASNGIQCFVYSIGTDIYQTGTAATTVKNGTLAAAAVGATTLTYTVTTTTAAPAVGDYLQIGPAKGKFGSLTKPTATTTAAKTTAFVTKVISVSGTGPYTLTVAAIPKAVAANAVAQAVKAPFYHFVQQASILPSMSIEKNLGGPSAIGGQSLLYGGCRVGKYSIKAATSNTEATFTATITAQSVQIVTSPTTLQFVTELPFVFAEYTLTWNTVTMHEASNLSVDITNGLKPIYCFNGSHELQFAPLTQLKVTGSFTGVWDSLNSGTYALWNQMLTAHDAKLEFTMHHLTGGTAVRLVMTHARLAKDTIDPKMADVIMEKVSFSAYQKLSTPAMISAVVANSVNLGY